MKFPRIRAFVLPYCVSPCGGYLGNVVGFFWVVEIGVIVLERANLKGIRVRLTVWPFCKAELNCSKYNARKNKLVKCRSKNYCLAVANYVYSCSGIEIKENACLYFSLSFCLRSFPDSKRCCSFIFIMSGAPPSITKLKYCALCIFHSKVDAQHTSPLDYDKLLKQFDSSFARYITSINLYSLRLF